MRNGEQYRTTKETTIYCSLNIDGSGIVEIRSGIGFFDHMLTALAIHAGWDMRLSCDGDLEVDGHHTVEDIGIVLGQTLSAILGDKGGIARYGQAAIPMDEALGQAILDVSGRAYLVFQADFAAPLVGGFETQLVEEFFRAFAQHAGITLHLAVPYGKNDHHKIEALFKAAAHALRRALMPYGEGQVLSTKGVLV